MLTLAVSSCGDDDDQEPERGAAATRALDPAQFSAVVDNPLFPLANLRATRFEGSEEDAEIRSQSRVLERTGRVAGVPVTVVDVREQVEVELYALQATLP